MLNLVLFLVIWTVFWVILTVASGLVIRIVKNKELTLVLTEALFGFVVAWVTVSVVEVILIWCAISQGLIPSALGYLAIGLLPASGAAVILFAFSKNRSIKG